MPIVCCIRWHSWFVRFTEFPVAVLTKLVLQVTPEHGLVMHFVEQGSITTYTMRGMFLSICTSVYAIVSCAHALCCDLFIAGKFVQELRSLVASMADVQRSSWTLAVCNYPSSHRTCIACFTLITTSLLPAQRGTCAWRAHAARRQENACPPINISIQEKLLCHPQLQRGWHSCTSAKPSLCMHCTSHILYNTHPALS